MHMNFFLHKRGGATNLRGLRRAVLEGGRPPIASVWQHALFSIRIFMNNRFTIWPHRSSITEQNLS